MGETDHEHNEVAYKLGTAGGMFAFTLACCYLPYMFKAFKTNKKLVGLGNALAGGIFLTAGLLHIIPEATELMEEGSEHSHSRFPWVPFTVICSFALILFIDRVVLPTQSKHTHSHNDLSPMVQEQTHPTPPRDGDLNELDRVHPQESERMQSNRGSSPPYETREERGEVILTQQPQADEIREEVPANRQSRMETTPEETNTQVQAQLQPQVGKQIEPIEPYAILLAMGFHAIFEGLALGIMPDLASFVGFLIAIVLHKWAESMALGISFFKYSVTKWKRLCSFIVFALLTPLGIVIGLLVHDTNATAKAILLAVSGGTFLYISVAEIITEEFAHKEGIYWRYLAFWVGVGINVLTWYLESLSDGHSH